MWPRSIAQMQMPCLVQPHLDLSLDCILTCSMVIDVAKKFFPQMALGYSDPRVKVGGALG